MQEETDYRMHTKTEHPKEHFNRLYLDVSKSIASAAAEIAELQIDHEEGKKEVGGMLDKLREIQRRFDGELDLLQQHAEWDKFTLAFFGETNAGKSTIIESLRILFKEESRQQLLEQNANELAKYEQALEGHVKFVGEALKTAYETHAAELMAIQASTASITNILRNEFLARTRRKLLVTALASFGAGALMVALSTLLMGR